MSRFSGLALAVDAPARMTIEHPFPPYQPIRDAAGEPAWIDLLSADSAAARGVARAAQNRRLRSRARLLTAEEIDAEQVEILVAITRGWRLLTLGGEEVDVAFSVAAARELYTDPEFSWLRAQVERFIGEPGNFQRQTTPTT